MDAFKNYVNNNINTLRKAAGSFAPPPPSAPKPAPVVENPAATFTPSSPNSAAEQAPAIQKPQVTGPIRQANQVSVEKLQSTGSETAFKAVLPSIAGGGAFLPVAVAFTKENVDGQSRATATLVDDKGHKLLDQNKQPVQLTVYQADNKFLIATNADPNSSPYIILEEDNKTGQIAYGLAEGLTHNGNLDQGYGIQRTELIEADGSRTLRSNEHYGPKTKPQVTGQAVLADLFSTGGLATGSILLDQATGKTGRAVDFTEVRMDANGAASASDVKYPFLPTGERPQTAINGMGAQLGEVWKQVKGTARESYPRSVMVTQQGDLTLTPTQDNAMSFNMNSLKNMFGSQTPRQTVTVRALSSDYVHNPAGAEKLQQGMTGGQSLTPEAG